MKKILLTLAAIFSIGAINVGLLVAPSYAMDTPEACKGRESEFPDLCKPGTEGDLQGTVGNVLNVIFGLIGVIAVIFVIIGGFKYTTSQGDPGKVQQAKTTITFALIGLVVTLGAFAITNFIIGALKG